jgi:hypothetical protein
LSKRKKQVAVCQVQISTRRQPGKLKSQNTKHAYKNNLMRPNGMIKVKCLETGKSYSSIKEAAHDCGITPICISNMLHGRTKTAGGYTWIKL